MRTETVKDCKGRVVCMVYLEMGLVELKCGKVLAYANLPVGDSFYVERENVATWVTRESEDRIRINSHQLI